MKSDPLPPLPLEDLELVDGQVDGDWEKLRKKNLFLTGGSGFFGSWLLETLLFTEDRRKLGVKVWALTRCEDRFRAILPHLAGHSAVRLVLGRAEDFEFPKERMDYVIHSMVPDRGMPLEEMEGWFERGTRRLLELAGRDRCEGFLLCSTGAVYQPQGRPLCEEDPLVPLDGPLTYGRIRRQVEEQCIKACKSQKISLKIVRGFSFAGPRLPENAGFALADFLRDAREGRPIRVNGSGSPIRSYLHAADMAVRLWKILFYGSEEAFFNLGSLESVRINDLAEKIAVAAKVPVEVLDQPSWGYAKNSHYLPQASKALSLLNISSPRSLKGILRESLPPLKVSSEKN